MSRMNPSVLHRQALLITAILALVSMASAGVLIPPEVELVQVATGLSTPVVITNAGDGSNRLFIVEKLGRIRIVENGTLLATPFLDIDSIVNSSSNEQGLLGLAFHPNYAVDGFFYVNYIDGGGDTVVSRFSVSAGDPNVADPASEFELLTADQPYSNHNGGQIEFGPDGFLYIALGDGGSGGDPGDRSQDLQELLGKLLRIDVDTPSPPLAYSIPADNPFVGVPGAAEEIWAYGLRNPWRFSFDRLTGDIFIGDVGQGDWEEIDYQPASSSGGENWGWRCYEGTHPYNLTGCGPIGNYDMPAIEYSSGNLTNHCSVTGGYRYRGSLVPGLSGAYIFGDYCSGVVWIGVWDPTGQSWDIAELDLTPTPFNLTTFGEDEQGDVYLASGSKVYVLTRPELVFSDGFDQGNTLAWSAVAP